MKAPFAYSAGRLRKKRALLRLLNRSYEHGAYSDLIPALKCGSRLLKAVWFVLICFLTGRTLGPSTAYINHSVATAICDFIYGDVNAETMYETYINIDILILVTSATVAYLITIKIFDKIRNK